MRPIQAAWWSAFALSALMALVAAVSIADGGLIFAGSVVLVQAWLTLSYFAVRSPRAVPAGQGVGLSKVAVVIAADTTGPELLAACLSHAEAAGHVRVLTENKQTILLASGFQIPVSSPETLLEDLPGEIDWVLFTDSSTLVKTESLGKLVEAVEASGAEWGSGPLLVQGVGAFSPEQHQKADVDMLVALASRGSWTWAANATLVKRGVLNDESMLKTWNHGPSVDTPNYSHLLDGVATPPVVVSEPLATWLPPLDPARFFKTRLVSLEIAVSACAHAIPASPTLRGKLWAGVGLLRQLRGWPWLIALLLPAVMSLSGLNPFTAPVWAWASLLLVAGLLRVLVGGPQTAEGLWKDLLSGLYELPVSIAATRGLTRPTRLPSALANTFVSRLLTWLASVELASAVAGVWLAASLPQTAQEALPTHLAGAFAAAVVGWVIMLAAARAGKWRMTGRLAARVPMNGVLEVGGTQARILDCSVGGVQVTGAGSAWKLGNMVVVKLSDGTQVKGRIARLGNDQMALSFSESGTGLLHWNRWLRLQTTGGENEHP